MKVERRRGISPIIAELLLVAITVGIGTTIFFVASSSIGGYTNGFSLLFNQNADAAKEVYIVEYAQFVSSPSHAVNITIRNVGSIETEVASVSLFNLTSVTVGSGYNMSGTYTTATAQPLAIVTVGASPYCTQSGTSIVIPVGSFCALSVPFNWESGAAYNLVVSTSRGNTIVVQEIA